MRKIVDHTWSQQRDVVPALALGCFDRRFKGWRGLIGEFMGFDENYPLIIPGGPKDLVMPEHPRDAEYLLTKMELLSDEYRIVIIMAHNECLACGRSKDLAFYEGLLRDARIIVQRRLPGKEIVCIFADFDGLYIIEDAPVAMKVA